MIRRDILDNPDKVLGSFDFFNDAKDTISWLRGREGLAREVRWKLEKANDEWLKAKNEALLETPPRCSRAMTRHADGRWVCHGTHPIEGRAS